MIRALGEMFHPDCFTCSVCQQPLDGVPFTVDAKNELHCVKDFNRYVAWQVSSLIYYADDIVWQEVVVCVMLAIVFGYIEIVPLL